MISPMEPTYIMNKKEGKEKKVETISMLPEHFFFTSSTCVNPQHTTLIYFILHIELKPWHKKQILHWTCIQVRITYPTMHIIHVIVKKDFVIIAKVLASSNSQWVRSSQLSLEGLVSFHAIFDLQWFVHQIDDLIKCTIQTIHQKHSYGSPNSFYP